nr:MAG TPA: hypothetical protein [Bacteriophage sp.]
MIRKVILKKEKSCRLRLKFNLGITGLQNKQIILQILNSLIKNIKIL